jgi:uncharacterized protein
MEDLLASIRKAIHQDIGGMPVPTRDQPAGVFKGSMRELRVKVGSEVTAAAAEIQELRDKINRTRESSAASPTPQAARSSVFTETRGGEAERPILRRPTEAAPPQILRPSFAEAELQPLDAARSEPVRRFSRDAETVVPAPDLWRDEAPVFAPPVEVRHQPADPGMLSAEATAAASSAFNRLADTILSRGVGDRSVEEMTRDLLRNMLKQWLDDNLPALVERLVREEIERVARRGR